MKISILLKYVVIFCLVVLITAFFISLYNYFEIGNANLDKIYKFFTPIILIIISFLYARKVESNGWIRGVEMWVAYFVILNLMKYIMGVELMDSIYKSFIYIPVCLLGGILGVNAK